MKIKCLSFAIIMVAIVLSGYLYFSEGSYYGEETPPAAINNEAESSCSVEKKSEQSPKTASSVRENDKKDEYTREELQKIRLQIMEEYPDATITDEDEYKSLFAAAFEHPDSTSLKLSLFLYNAKIGTQVAGINFCTDAEFASIEELSETTLLYCAIRSARCFCWDATWKNDPYFVPDADFFRKYTDDVEGFFKEDVEKQAYTYFGEDAKVNHFAELSNDYRNYNYYEYAGVHTPIGRGGGPPSYPFVLSYTELENGYEVIFVSIQGGWRQENRFSKLDAYFIDSTEDEMLPKEAVEWYTEHGAQARVILEEQEDGRLIVKSLEILRGYDTLEEIEERKAYGK